DKAKILSLMPLNHFHQIPLLKTRLAKCMNLLLGRYYQIVIFKKYVYKHNYLHRHPFSLGTELVIMVLLAHQMGLGLCRKRVIEEAFSCEDQVFLMNAILFSF
ncbi:hypothetical protein ACJX0J_004792, partial (mitochondrion) [Zea mays]